ncbi:MAG: lipocalin family protein [Acidobacteria bacterium]|nr:lipocalin family protein [Acidobacteriota bacterium]
MRFLLLLFIVIFAANACNRADKPAAADKAIIGTWKLMEMTSKPFPAKEISESDVIGGHMTFKEDKTFEGEVVYPKTPDKNLKVSGTYSVEGQTLTVNNQANNSTTKSTLRFEDDMMIATPEKQGAVISYYKRIR